MRTHYLIILLSFLGLSLQAQKLKGNKIIEARVVEIDTFYIANIKQEFNVALVYQESPSVTVETDSNLQEFIHVEVDEDKKLWIFSDLDLSKAKKLLITIGYNELFRELNVGGKVKANGTINLNSKEFTLNVYEAARMGIEVESAIFNLNVQDKARFEGSTICYGLNINTDGSTQTELKSNNNIEELNITLKENSKCDIVGNAKNAVINVRDNTRFKGGKLNISQNTINAEGSAKAYVKTTGQLNINASKKAEIYVIGTSDIVINGFKNEAKIIKTDKTGNRLL